RPQHRLPADERRTRRCDRDPADPGVQHGNPRRRPGSRRGRLALPVPAAAAGHRRAAAYAAAEAALMAAGVAVPRSARAKAVRRHVLIYLGLMPFLVLAVFPIFWMAVTALKQEPDLYRMRIVPFWFHLPPTWKNFTFLCQRTSYADWIVNTMSISFWVSTITLLTAVPAGYALARLRLRFAENLGIAVFVTYLVPAIILFIPLARVVSTLGLQ